MDFIAFEIACIKHAWNSTKEIPPLSAILISIGTFIFAACLDIYLRGWDVAIAEASTVIIWAIPVVIVAIVIYTFNLLLAPSQIIKEKENEISILNDELINLNQHISELSESPRPTVSLVEAVYYVAFRKWGILSVIDDTGEYKDNKTRNTLLVSIEQVRHEARSERLPIWGIDKDNNGNVLYDEIEDVKNYWREFWPNEEFFKYNSSQEMALELLFNEYAKDRKAYDWFYTHKKTIEKLWPP